MNYREYTIQKEYYGYSFYKTSEGIDCSFDNDSWHSNTTWCNSIESAKCQIDQIILEEEANQMFDAVTSGFIKI